VNNLIPIEELPAAIERLLKDAPRVIPELARLTGYSEGAVRVRLETFEQEKRAHCISKGAQKRGKGYNEWHHGQAPAHTVAEQAGKGAIPQQRITDKFPPCDRRDSLVEALFGPARASLRAPDASGMPSPIVDSAPAAAADVALTAGSPLTPSRSTPC
jgi:hypothetical protein